MKRVTTLLLILLCLGIAFGQSTTFGTSDDEGGLDAYVYNSLPPLPDLGLTDTSDGGYLTAHNKGQQSSRRAVVTKYSSTGAISWKYEFDNIEAVTSASERPNGNILIAGRSTRDSSLDNGVQYIELSATGQVLDSEKANYFWYNIATDIKHSQDGGFAMSAFEGGRGKATIWKYDSNNNIEFSRRYQGVQVPGCTSGALFDSTAESLITTSDGGFALPGSSRMEGWCINRYNYPRRATLAKTDIAGNIQWDKTYTTGTFGDHQDAFASGIETSDGGFLLAGFTDGQGAGSFDFWVVKTDSTGTIQWQKAYGGSGSDRADSVTEVNGGYVVAGSTDSFGAGGKDVWVIKIDATGNIVWEHAYGGGQDDIGFEVRELASGDIVVAADTASFGAGGRDLWVLHLDSNGKLPSTCSAPISTSAQVTTTTAVESTYNLITVNIGRQLWPRSPTPLSSNDQSQNQCPSQCGDGVTQFGEYCDAATGQTSAQCPDPRIGTSCTADCSQCIQYCGNGIVEGTELCDDGNQNNGDQCSSTCMWEDNDGDGVYDVEEVQVGADPFDADSYPAYLKVDAQGIVRIYVENYGSGYRYRQIDRDPYVSARLTDIVDQDGNPVTAYWRNGNTNPPSNSPVNWVYTNQWYSFHKTPSMQSISGTAVARQSVLASTKGGGNWQTREVTKPFTLDVSNTPPVTQGPQSAATTSVRLAVQVSVYSYPYNTGNSITGNVVTNVDTNTEGEAYGDPGGISEPVESSTSTPTEPGTLAECCMFEDPESPTGYSWNMTNGGKAVVEVVEVGKKVVTGSELNIYTPLEYPLVAGDNYVNVAFDTFDDYWNVIAQPQMPEGCVLMNDLSTVTVDKAPEAMVLHIQCDQSASLLTAAATHDARNRGKAPHIGIDFTAEDCTRPGCPSQKVSAVIDVAKSRAAQPAKERSPVLQGRAIVDVFQSGFLGSIAITVLGIVAIVGIVALSIKRKR